MGDSRKHCLTSGDFISLEEWLDRWGRPEDQTRLTKIHGNLVKRYSEHHRYYHNIDHIAACLDEFSVVKNLIQHPFEAWLAIWFHDVVYDPRDHSNEEKSRDYAMKELKGIMSDDSLEKVSRFIITTKHDASARDDDERFMMDIDLTILGRRRDSFDEYEESIRREYAWVPEDRFRKGRMVILMGFLDRDSIYQTDYFREKYEEKARQNLRYSISRLKKGD